MSWKGQWRRRKRWSRRSRVGMRRFIRWMKRWYLWSLRSKPKLTSSSQTWQLIIRCRILSLNWTSVRIIILDAYLIYRNYAKVSIDWRMICISLSWARSFRMSHLRHRVSRSQLYNRWWHKMRTNLIKAVKILIMWAKVLRATQLTVTKWLQSKLHRPWTLSPRWKPLWRQN